MYDFDFFRLTGFEADDEDDDEDEEVVGRVDVGAAAAAEGGRGGGRAELYNIAEDEGLEGGNGNNSG